MYLRKPLAVIGLTVAVPVTALLSLIQAEMILFVCLVPAVFKAWALYRRSYGVAMLSVAIVGSYSVVVYQFAIASSFEGTLVSIFLSLLMSSAVAVVLWLLLEFTLGREAPQRSS